MKNQSRAPMSLWLIVVGVIIIVGIGVGIFINNKKTASPTDIPSSSPQSTPDLNSNLKTYNNNGIRFEYPGKLNTSYATLSENVSVDKLDNSKLDKNGCYTTISSENGKPTPTTPIKINGINFCYAETSGVGAGQLYTNYIYTTLRNENVYTIDYSVHSSNGCGAYQNSTDLNSPDNQKYNECLAAQKNFPTTVVKPIQDSISTFSFVE